MAKRKKKDNPPTYWDTHPLAIQRFYKVACLVYGSNPDKLESLRKESMLPVERAWDLVKMKDSAGLFPGRIEFVWLEPNSQEQKRIHNSLKAFTGLTQMIERLNNLLNLKNDITIYMTPSCRAADAWWDGSKNIITVCYDLIKEFEENSLLLPNLVKQLKSGSR